MEIFHLYRKESRHLKTHNLRIVSYQKGNHRSMNILGSFLNIYPYYTAQQKNK